MSARSLGRIALLQIQRERLKAKGVGYDIAPLLRVAEMSVGPGGVAGRHDGGWVLNVHHEAHPRAVGGGNRALSIGFTGHYRLMEQRFGSRSTGYAGENIVVKCEEPVTEADLSEGVAIRGSHHEIVLTGARVAAPCREFVAFLRGLDEVPDREEADADLDFLDHGMRGFILDVAHLTAPVTVSLGDEVVVMAPL